MLNLISQAVFWDNLSFIEHDFDKGFISEKENENYTLEEFYINGRKCPDGTVRLYCVLAQNKLDKNAPVVVAINDFSSEVDLSFIDYFINLGYSVVMCDTKGDEDSKKRTFYPSSLKHCSYKNRGEYNFSSPDTITNSPEYVWTENYIYLINFLRAQNAFENTKFAVVGINEGSTTAWHLSVCEKNITATVAIMYAGWKERAELIDSENNLETAFSLAIDPQSYSEKVKTPFLFLTTTNNEETPLDRAFDTMARMNGQVESLMSVEPNSITSLGLLGTRNLKLFLNKHLKGEDVEIYGKPIIKATNLGGKLLITCENEEESEPLNVIAYFCEGEGDLNSKVFEKKTLAKGADDFNATINVGDSEKRIFVFANVEYKNGITQTSNLISIVPKTLNIESKLVKQNIIYNGLLGMDTFTSHPKMSTDKATQLFCSSRVLEVDEGADGIFGISSKEMLGTFKLSHEKYQGEEGELLVIDIYSQIEQDIMVIVLSQKDDNKRVKYTACLKTVGGPLWQNFKLEVSDFLDENNVSLEKWEDIKFLMFKSPEKFILNNMLWI